MTCNSAPFESHVLIEAIHKEMLGNRYQQATVTTIKVEGDGHLCYALESIHSLESPSIRMLVMRREEAGDWKICAETRIQQT